MTREYAVAILTVSVILVSSVGLFLVNIWAAHMYFFLNRKILGATVGIASVIFWSVILSSYWVMHYG